MQRMARIPKISDNDRSIIFDSNNNNVSQLNPNVSQMNEDLDVSVNCTTNMVSFVQINPKKTRQRSNNAAIIQVLMLNNKEELANHLQKSSHKTWKVKS